jgi:hypothetical protein
MADKKQDDLVDAGSEYSFPASDPPSYMGGTATAGAPAPDSVPGAGVCTELSDSDEAKPAESAPQGTDPARTHPQPSRVRMGTELQLAAGAPSRESRHVGRRGLADPGSPDSDPNTPLPPAGPHADPQLMNGLSTPGTGALTPVGVHDDVDSTSS